MTASALSRLAVLIVCVTPIACEPPSRPNPNALATLQITQVPALLEVGESSQLTVYATNTKGLQTVGRPVEWESSTPSVVSVSQAGVVTGVGIGSATIRATSEGVRDSIELEVIALRPRDVRVVDAHFTQGTQPLDTLNRIPLVRDKAAVVNALVVCTPACVAPVSVILRVFAADGTTLLYADTTATEAPPSTSASFASPNAQFLVPKALITAVLYWQLEVDPANEVLGNDKDNDLFPLTGTLQHRTVEVPPLKLRFIPIELTAYVDSSSVTLDQLPAYLRLARSLYPLGSVTATIGPTVQSPRVYFGNGPAFVAGIMADVDNARWITETDLETHWIGVLKRPPSLAVSFGGMGYIPSSSSAVGLGARTVIVYQAGTQGIDLTSQEAVAHELGHNFGRWHTPCGGAPFPGSFPYAGGTINEVGHDVFAWAEGIRNSAIPIPATRGDVMGYCLPTWISDFTYRGVAEFRAADPSLQAAPAEPTRTLVIGGKVREDGRIELDSLQTLDARPALPAGGRYRLRGIGSDRRVLFTYSFDPPRVSAATDQHFRFYVPLTSELETAMQRVEVSGPTGRAVSRTWQR